jgi:hypothetical protein
MFVTSTSTMVSTMRFGSGTLMRLALYPGLLNNEAMIGLRYLLCFDAS